MRLSEKNAALAAFFHGGAWMDQGLNIQAKAITTAISTGWCTM